MNTWLVCIKHSLNLLSKIWLIQSSLQLCEVGLILLLLLDILKDLYAEHPLYSVCILSLLYLAYDIAVYIQPLVHLTFWMLSH